MAEYGAVLILRKEKEFIYLSPLFRFLIVENKEPAVLFQIPTQRNLAHSSVHRLGEVSLV